MAAFAWLIFQLLPREMRRGEILRKRDRVTCSRILDEDESSRVCAVFPNVFHNRISRGYPLISATLGCRETFGFQSPSSAIFQSIS